MQALKSRFRFYFQRLRNFHRQSFASSACSSRLVGKYETQAPCKMGLFPMFYQNQYSVSSKPTSEVVDNATFEKTCQDTLESLTDYFEELVQDSDALRSADVSYNTGVLTIYLGQEHGTYVINRQSPNKQIWLSSPTSGPKRYDFIPSQNCWVYRHTGETLHCLLQNEISKILKDKTKVDFSVCSFAKL